MGEESRVACSNKIAVTRLLGVAMLVGGVHVTAYAMHGYGFKATRILFCPRSRCVPPSPARHGSRLAAPLNRS
jgi:hypothetical protein